MTIEHVTRGDEPNPFDYRAWRPRSAKKSERSKANRQGRQDRRQSCGQKPAEIAGKGIGRRQKTAKASPECQKSTSQRSKKIFPGGDASSKPAQSRNPGNVS